MSDVSYNDGLVTLQPVENDPYAVNLTPVDHDPYAVNLTPVDHDPFGVAPVAKAGQTIQPVTARPMTGQAAMSALSVPDISKMTPDEQQMFALGAMPMLVGGPEAKIAEEVIPEAAQAIKQGIRAYHGSPYDFDRFDLSKIGTGEGAQAYGHGLYFAEHPNVAQEYRDQLRWKGADWDDPQIIAQNMLDKHFGDRSKAADDLAKAIESQKQITNPAQQLSTANNINALELLRGSEPITGKPPIPGRMYEVAINADPEHFLDWDKPLSEQSPKVQEAILSSDHPMMKYWAEKSQENPNYNGNDLYLRLQGDKGLVADKQAAASQALRDAGIPGIKYLDQGSRANAGWRMLPPSDSVSGKWVVGHAPNGPNQFFENEADARAAHEAGLPATRTSNYVVFDDKLISIIKKYGLAGLISSGAAHFKTTPVDHNPFAQQ